MLRPLIPPRLSRGDTVGVVAPASPPSAPEKIERGIAFLERSGFPVKRGRTLSLGDGYLAGNDASRAADLNGMFADPGVRAIFCSRGGFGCTRILDRIDYRLVRAHPKILVGFSDVTAISMALWKRCGLVTFAGPMVAAEMQAGMDAFTEEALWALLLRRRASQPLPLPGPLENGAIRVKGRAEGVLIGGNLAVLTCLIGTPFAPSWSGGILFLEDVGENVYKIDRMLSHLKNAGVLSALAGVLLGSFTSIPEETPNRALEDVLLEYILPLNIPVLAGIPFGHSQTKMTLPLGARVRMDATRGTIRVLHHIVS